MILCSFCVTEILFHSRYTSSAIPNSGFRWLTRVLLKHDLTFDQFHFVHNFLTSFPTSSVPVMKRDESRIAYFPPFYPSQLFRILIYLTACTSFYAVKCLVVILLSNYPASIDRITSAFLIVCESLTVLSKSNPDNYSVLSRSLHGFCFLT